MVVCLFTWPGKLLIQSMHWYVVLFFLAQPLARYLNLWLNLKVIKITSIFGVQTVSKFRESRRGDLSHNLLVLSLKFGAA